MLRSLIFFVALSLAACGARPQAPAQVLAVGDSILVWNRLSGTDIPTQVAAKTDLEIRNNAVSGARFLGADGIQSQFEPGPWTWVIVNGGGNDLRGACGQPEAAQAILDRLIAPDLGGAYAAFLARVQRDGADVILLGYAPVSVAGGPFAGCSGVLDELNARQRRLADTMDGVFFVNARDVIRPEDRAAYSIDRVHPTPYAGDLMSSQIAAILMNDR